MSDHIASRKTPSLDEIRWGRVWQEQMTRNHACRNFQECASTWVTEEKARAFWRAACKNQERYTPIVEMIAAAHPRCVLDIGGGPGSLALPLAGRGIRITVVEPASGMITLLKENSVTRKLSGIHPIHKRWEDIEIQDLDMPYDVVVACFSLGMPDIVGAIQKMEHVCSGKIFLIWFAGTTPWEDIVQNLWPVYHQRPYEPGPKSDILFQVLYQMGIYPDVTVRKEQYIEEQTRISDLVDDYAERLCVPEGADRQPIGEYFKTLNICTDGVFRFPGELTTMTFSWKSRG